MIVSIIKMLFCLLVIYIIARLVFSAFFSEKASYVKTLSRKVIELQKEIDNE